MPHTFYVTVSPLYFHDLMFGNRNHYKRVWMGGGGGGPLVGCRLKFSNFVGSRLKFSIFVGSRLNFLIFVGCQKISVNK